MLLLTQQSPEQLKEHIDMARSEKNLTAVFTDTASAIRAKAGTTEQICPLDFADKINSIETGGGGMKAFLEAGGKFGYSKVTTFDGLINYSDTENLILFNNLFRYCKSLRTAPNMDMSAATQTGNMFYYCYDLRTIPSYNMGKVEISSEMFEYCSALTEIPELDVHSVVNASYMFYNCTNLKRTSRLYMPNAQQVPNMFYDCKKLEEVGEFSLNSATSAGGMFGNCSSLKFLHLRDIGVDLDISASTLFERDALLEVINNLKTVTSTKTLTMGATNLAKLTNEDKAIATNKGWTLA